MGDGSIRDTLWRAKFTIALALMLLVAAATASIVYTQKRNLQSELSGIQSDYNTLNDKYKKLVSDHATLTADHDSLNKKYDDLNDRYNQLSVNNSYLQSSYNGLSGKFTDLNNTVSGFEDGGGAYMALRYSSYESSSNKKIVDAYAYNVGTSRATRVYIRCKIQDNSTISTQTQEFDNIDPIHKSHAHWEFNDTVLIQSVWVDMG